MTNLFFLAILFSAISLLSFGGGATLIPEVHKLVVNNFLWMNDRQFTDFYAISQASPGPNILFIPLIGWHVSGFLGGIIAALAVSIPTSFVTFYTTRFIEKYKKTVWYESVQAGLMPVTLGLTCATAFLIARLAAEDEKSVILTAVAAAISLIPNISPFWIILGAAVIGCTFF